MIVGKALHSNLFMYSYPFFLLLNWEFCEVGQFEICSKNTEKSCLSSPPVIAMQEPPSWMKKRFPVTGMGRSKVQRCSQRRTDHMRWVGLNPLPSQGSCVGCPPHQVEMDALPCWRYVCMSLINAQTSQGSQTLLKSNARTCGSNLSYVP